MGYPVACDHCEYYTKVNSKDVSCPQCKKPFRYLTVEENKDEIEFLEKHIGD